MTSGFFWKVPGVSQHFIYTDVSLQTFLDADFKKDSDVATLKRWDKVPIADRVTLLLLHSGDPDASTHSESRRGVYSPDEG